MGAQLGNPIADIPNVKKQPKAGLLWAFIFPSQEENSARFTFSKRWAQLAKQVGVLGMRRNERLDLPTSSCMRAHPHNDCGGCTASRASANANHLRAPAEQQANSLAADVGQITFMSKPPLRTCAYI
jgi:hypothetical protein